MNAHRFDRLMLKTRTVGAEATKDGIRVMFEGPDGAKSEGLYDPIVAGRRPHAQRQEDRRGAGVIVGERGFIPVDVQMRTNVPHIFAIGDIVGQPMLAHKAVHEAHVAAEVAAGEKTAFDARVIPSVAYTDPEVLGRRHRRRSQGAGLKVKKGLFLDGLGPCHRQRPRRRVHQAAVRRGDAPHRRRRHRRHACRRHDRRGGAGHRDGRDAVDIGKTIHPHPTLGEYRSGGRGLRGRAPTFRRCEAVEAQRGAGALRDMPSARASRAERSVLLPTATVAGQRGRVVAGCPAGGLCRRSVGARDAQRRAEAVRRRLRARVQREVVLGVRVGAPRGVDLVLGVEQIQQAALADVELLAVGVARLSMASVLAQVDQLLGQLARVVVAIAATWRVSRQTRSRTSAARFSRFFCWFTRALSEPPL